jgi:protocadherin Fat 4
MSATRNLSTRLQALARRLRRGKKGSGHVRGAGGVHSRRPLFESLEDRRLLAGDIKLWIPQDLGPATPGSTVVVPVKAEVTDAAGVTISGFDVALHFDSTKLSVVDSQLGALVAPPASDIQEGGHTVPEPGWLVYEASGTNGSAPLSFGTIGNLFMVTFMIAADAPPGDSVFNLLSSYIPPAPDLPQPTAVFDNTTADLEIDSAPTNADTDTVDGLLTIVSSVTVAVSPSSVAEDGTVDLDYTFTRTGGTANPLTVTFTTGGAADDASDYVVGGAGVTYVASTNTGTVTIPAGSSSAVVKVDPTVDTAVENDEDVVLTVAPGASYVAGAQDSASATIANDDTGLAIAPDQAVKSEGNTATTPFTFTVTRTGLVTGATDVTWTVAGSGTSPADAADFAGGTPLTDTLSFAAYETSKTITVNVNGDTTVEPDETFTVTLSSPTGGATLLTSAADGTIQNDDTGLAITATDASKTEGDSGSKAFTFTVTRTGLVTGTTDVTWAVAGSGTNPADAADFAGGTLPGDTLSFAADETSKAITVNVNGDATVELDETFIVTLSGPTNGAVLLTAAADGTIQNDDVASSVVGSHNVAAGYPAEGGWLWVNASISYPTDKSLLSLLWRPELPAGWSLVAVTGSGSPEIQQSEIVFTGALTANPLTFSYQVSVPAGETGTKQITGGYEYQLTGMVNAATAYADPNPLLVEAVMYHSADYREPYWSVDGTEMNRVLSYWRAGAYHANLLGADGYAAGTGDSGTSPRHAADYRTPDWVIDGTEMNRVLSYWRAGAYHPNPDGADGYAPGTAPAGAGALFDGFAAADDFASLLGLQGVITHEASSTVYVPGGAVTVSGEIPYTDTLLSLLWRPKLPTGWTFDSVVADGTVEVAGGDILWTGTLPPSPVSVQYVIHAPAGASGTQQVRSEVETAFEGDVNPSLTYADPDPLILSQTTPASIGNLVWRDTNNNGVQDGGEPGIDGVTVNLLDGTGNTTGKSTATAGGGLYSFGDLLPGDYIVEFVASAGLVFTARDLGSDDTLDSDADPLTGRTSVITLAGGVDNTSIDAGLVPLQMWISEILFNPPGTDAPNEYVELRGTPGATIPAGTYLVGIEGDSNQTPGDVQDIFELSGKQFGANGYMVLLQKGSVYTAAAGSSVYINTGDGAGWGSGATSSIGHTADGNATDIENNSVTFLLIQAPLAPTLGDDIDAYEEDENEDPIRLKDGIPDGPVYLSWTIHDSIGILDSSTTRDYAYGAMNFKHASSGGVSMTGIVQPVGTWNPGYVARYDSQTGADASDWVASLEALGGTAAPPTGESGSGWTLGIGTNVYPDDLSGSPLDHIGAPNPPAANNPPVITSNGGGDTAAISIVENTTAVTTVTATDADSETPTYAIVGGIDSARFTINPTTGVLTFVTAPDYEVPSDAGGNNTYVVQVKATDGKDDDLQTITVTVTDAVEVVINEVDSDTLGTDTQEFVELYGAANTSLNGLVLVFYNGIDDRSYRAIDLDGYSTNGNGFFVVGNSGVPNVDLTFANGTLQNGADAVALYLGHAADFPTDTPATATNLVDALVYGTGHADDAGLIDVLTPGQAQINENGNNKSDVQSNSRRPDGGTPRNTATYVQQAPTPGTTNLNTPPTGVSLSPSPASLAENTSTATSVKVADITITDDALGTNTLSLTGADAGSFVLVGAELHVAAGVVLNFETKPSYSVTVQVDDTTVGETPDASVAFVLNLTDVNESPTAVTATPNPASLAENTSTVASVKVADLAITDDALGTNTLSLTGADAASFVLVGTELHVAAGVVLNFEAKPSYSVTVQVDDTTVGETPDTSVVFVLNLTDVNEAPTAVTATPNPASLTENTSTATSVKVADLAITDDALGTNALSLTGADAGSFVLVGTELHVAAGVVLNFESKPSYSVTVQVDDTTVGETPDASVAFVLNLTDVNEAPTAVTATPNPASLAENTSTATSVKVADLAITDDALGTNTLSLTGADAGSFVLVGTELHVATGVVLNFEAKPSYSVTVQVDDTTVGVTPDASVAFVLNLTDVNEAPTAVTATPNPASVAENTSTATSVKVADLAITDDALGTNTPSLTGADAASFVLVGTELHVAAGVVLNFESKPSYSVTVQVDDTTVGETPDASVAFVLNLTDVNEAPTAVTATPNPASLTENTSTATSVKVADLAITDDALGTNALSLTGADAASFVLVGTELHVAAGVVLNFESKPSYSVTVQVDDTTVGATPDASVAFVLNLTDVNEAPTAVTATPNPASLAENTSTVASVKVADLAITDDALGTNTLSLTGADAASFVLVGTELHVAAGVVLNFESKPSYSVTVQVDDTTVGATPDASVAFVLNLTDVNEAPTAVTATPNPASVAENTSTATSVKLADLAITDDALGTNTLSLTGADAASFVLVGTELHVAAGVVLNFESKPSYSVTVQVDDTTVGETPDASVAFVLNLTDVNEAPTAVTATPNPASLAENTSTVASVKVADLAITDDALGTNTLSLTGADAASFVLVGTELHVAAGAVLNFEAKPSYSVTVQVDDTTVGATPDASVAFVLNLTDVNEAPTAVTATPNPASLAENTSTAASVKIADLAITDDALGTNTLSLTGADAASFVLVGTELHVAAGAVLNFEAKPSYSVTVQVDDTTVGATPDASVAFVLNLTDVNEAPTAVTATPNPASLAENTSTAASVKIADLAITDDALGTNTLSLTGADAGSFVLVGTELHVAAGVVLNFEAKPSYSVTVQVDDTTVGVTPDASVAFVLNLTDVNEAPTAVTATPNPASLAENTSTAASVKIADLAITDDALGTNTLSLTGADAGSFVLVGTELHVAAGVVLNFETKPSYSVTVQVDDTTVGVTPDASVAFVLNLTDVNGAPTAVTATPNPASVAENTSTATSVKVADITVTDDGAGTNTLSLTGADAASFVLVGTELHVAAGVVLNFEAKPSYSVTVQVDDTTVGATPDASVAFVLNLTDVNEAPTAVTATPNPASLTENTSTATSVKVADLAITDDALGTNALSLTGADAASFVLVGTELHVAAGVVLNFESKPSYSVTVQVDDTTVGVTPDASVAFVLNLTDVNEAPTAVTATPNPASLAENTSTAASVKIADLAITDDALGTNTLSLTGADAGSFVLVGTELHVAAGVVLNFEAKPSYSVTVQVDDTTVGATPDASVAFVLNLTDVNEAPTAVTATPNPASLAENTSTATSVKVADLAITDDALGTNTLSLTGADAGSFVLVGMELHVATGVVLNFEAKPSYSVTVQVDDTTVGVTPDASVAFVLNLTDVNEAPTAVTATPNPASLAENTSTVASVKVADLAITDDALGTNTLSLTGADAGSFVLVGMELHVATGVVLNFEAKPSYSVTVQVDDTTVGVTPDASVAFVLNLTDVNEAPTAVTATPNPASLAENTSTVASVKVADLAITDDALGTNTLSLTGADAGSFVLVGTELHVAAGVVLNFEAKPSYSVTVQVDDTTVGETPDVSVAFVLNLTDVNEAPTAVTATPNPASLAENTSTAASVKVADLAITDDALGTNTLSLTGADAGSFVLVGTELHVAAGVVLNFEAKPSYSVTVQVDDTTVGATPDASVAFVLNLTDVNEAPTAVTATPNPASLAENTSTVASVKVADLAITDDALGTNTLSLTGADAGSFVLVGTELHVATGVVLNFEAKPSYSVTVQVDDTTVGVTPDASVAFVLNLTDVNEAPTAVTATPNPASVAENTSTATSVKVADLAITDDALGTNTLSLTGADAGSFVLVGTELHVAAGVVLNFEAKPSYSVTVQVDDTTVGATPDASVAFVLNLTDVNEAPTAVTATPNPASLAENTSTVASVKVADLAITDDALGTNALSLTGADAGSFVLVGTELHVATGVVLNFEAKPSYSVTVQVDDTTVGVTPDASVAFVLNLTDVNEAPTAVTATPNPASVAENTSTATSVKVADLAITDDALGTNTLSLTGADAASFVLVGTELHVAAGVVLNFEAKPSYSVTVQVDDTTVGETPDASVAFVLNLTDVNESPTAVTATPNPASLAENTSTAASVKVADLAITDDALGTNTLSLTGADAASFVLVGTELHVAAGVVLNFEAKPSYSVTVQVDDTTVGETPDTSVAFVLNLTDVNEAPTAVTATPNPASLAENTSTAASVKVADLAITDDALGTNTLSLTGADAASFVLVGTELHVAAGVVLNFEAKPSYSVTVQVDDTTVGETPDTSVAFVLNLTDVNEAPTAVTATPNPASLAENTSTATSVKVADLAITDDALGTNTLSLTGADAGAFVLVGTELHVAAGVVLNFEAKPSYSVTVQVDDTTVGVTPDASVAFVLNLTDVNGAPTAVTATPNPASLAENTSTATSVKVADITVIDDGAGTNTLSLTGADAASFVLVGTELHVAAGVVLNFEAKPSYSVTVQVDDTTVGETPDASVAFVLNLTDVNEAPTAVTATPNPASLAENTSTVASVKVADLAITDDALGTNTLSLTGADAGSFVLVGTELHVATGVVLNFEAKPSYSVTVQVDDTTVGATSDASVAFVLNLTDVNEAPTAVTATPNPASLTENTSTATSVKVADLAITDDALGTNTLSLTGADAGSFVLVGTELHVATGVVLNFEFKPSYNVTVQVDDTTVGETPDTSVAFVLNLTDVNEAPTAVTATPNPASVAENRSTAISVKVADITVTDDGAGTNTLSLTGADAGSFVLVGTELHVAAGVVLNFEAKPSYSVTVQVDDTTVGETPDASVAFVLNLTDVNEAPTAVTATPNPASLAENTSTATSVKVADITVTDDGAGTNTLSLTGADAASFVLVGTELHVAAGVVLNFESKPSYSVTVQVDDTTVGETPDVSVAFVLNLTDVNEAPTAVTATPNPASLAENTSTATSVKVADLAITDDALGTNTLSLTGADAASFVLVGTELHVAAGAVLNFESKPSYSVTVQVDDTTVGETPDASVAFVLNLTDVNEAPVIESNGGGDTAAISVAENTTAVTTVEATDADGTTPTYAIVGGVDAGKFAIDETSGVLKFVTAPDFEMPTDDGGNNTYIVVVRATDGVNHDDQTITVTVTPVNDNLPVFTSSATPSVPENTAAVVMLTATDADRPTQTVTFRITGGADQDLFEIVNSELRFKTAPDYEKPGDVGGNNVYEVSVTADDGESCTVDQNLTVTVTPVNDNSPVFISNGAPNVAENTTAVVMLEAPDADRPVQTVSFTITGGADRDLFEIVGGELRFKDAPDYEHPADDGGDNVYQVTVEASDGNGGTTTQELTVTVTNETGEFAQVASIVVDKGAAQRSMVRSLTVTFDKEVTVLADAFSVIKREVGGGGSPVALNAPVIGTNAAGHTVVTLTFAAGAFRGPGNSLVDGNYQLTIDASRILAGGEELDGDGDNASGGDHEFGEVEADAFFRLFGDGNGDRLVDGLTGSVDLSMFAATYGKRAGQAGFNDAFDYDGDGDVDGTDLFWFRGQRNKEMPFI